MILLYGIREDAMIRWMSSELVKLGYGFELLDEIDIQNQLSIVTWNRTTAGSVEGEISVRGTDVKTRHVTGVYVRPCSYVVDEVGESLNNEGSEWTVELQQQMAAFFDACPGVVVNRPKFCRTNDSKPYQQLLLRRAGFLTPDTIVTTCPKAAEEFIEQCRGEVIYKSVSGSRSVVRKLTAADTTRLRFVAHCPTQFQRYVPGNDIRVHVVKDRVFSCEIISTAEDYRYASVEPVKLMPFALPAEVAQAAIHIVREMGLLLAGLDFRLDHDGHYVCFEINPSPAFAYFQRHTGQPIAEAVAHVLAAG